MRYVKWILLLIVIIIVFLEILHNLDTFSTQLTFSLKVPGRNPTVQVNFLTMAILLFSTGFTLAILIEIYFWFKYSRAIRQQNRIIQSLRKELAILKPTPASTSLPGPSEEDATKTLPGGESAD